MLYIMFGKIKGKERTGKGRRVETEKQKVNKKYPQFIWQMVDIFIN